MLRGIDVSHWQGQLDWRALAAGLGLDFAFVKATEHEGFVDPRFRSNWVGMADAGLVRGAYHFARPDGSAVDDAARFVAVVKAAGLVRTDLVALDLEVSDLKAAPTAAWAIQWGREVQELLPGYRVGLYSGAGYMTLKSYRGLSHVHGGPFAWWWYPQWPGGRSWPAAFTPRIPGDNQWGDLPVFWQFTDNVLGRRIDGDVFSGTRAELEALNGSRPNPGPPPVPAPPAVRSLGRLLRVASPRMTGGDVRAVQGAAGMNRADQDGVYGWQTRYHVWRFQRARRLAADGVVGPQTARAMGFRWAGR